MEPTASATSATEIDPYHATMNPSDPDRNADSSGPVPLRASDLAARLAAGEQLVLLDVREAEELAICALEGAVHVPLSELSVRHIELDPDAPTVCICHHGVRSAHAAAGLARLGFERLFNLVGGVDRWAIEVDPSMPRY